MRFLTYCLICCFLWSSAAAIAMSCCWGKAQAAEMPKMAHIAEQSDMPCHGSSALADNKASPAEKSDEADLSQMHQCECQTCFDTKGLGSHNKILLRPPVADHVAVLLVNVNPDSERIYHPPKTLL